MAAVVFLSCNSQTENTFSVEAEAVYADYRIWGEEGKENVTCLFQFFSDKRKKTTLLLEPPAAITLDGDPLQADSARLSGTFYEVQKPITEFSGTHTLTFITADGLHYAEKFAFTPFRLLRKFDHPVRKSNLVLPLEGLDDGTVLRVVMTDTSFHSKGINHMDTVSNGQVVIEDNLLQHLRAGPIVLQIFKEEERFLNKSSALNGTISISYGLKRVLEMKD